MLEGVSETVVRLAHYAYKEKLMWRAGLAMLSGGFSKLKDLTDWKQYGGAPLLGFDHLLIKAHGRSQAPAVKNAIKVAWKAVSSGLLDDIRTGLLQGGLVAAPEIIAPVSSGPLALAAAGVAAAVHEAKSSRPQILPPSDEPPPDSPAPEEDPAEGGAPGEGAGR
jgi:hypothetical protein